MKLSLEENFVIHTPIDSDAIRKKLEDNIEKVDYFFRVPYLSNHKYFEGQISGYEFKATKIIFYKNSFLPVIRGEIKGNSVYVNMELSQIVKALMYIWYAAFFLLAVSSLDAISKDGVTAEAAAPVIFFAVACAAPIYGFKSEAIKQKEFLKNLLGGTIDER